MGLMFSTSEGKNAKSIYCKTFPNVDELFPVAKERKETGMFSVCVREQRVSKQQSSCK